MNSQPYFFPRFVIVLMAVIVGGLPASAFVEEPIQRSQPKVLEVAKLVLYLRAKGADGVPEMKFCSGTLLASNVILTFGSCVSSSPVQSITAILENNQRSEVDLTATQVQPKGALVLLRLIDPIKLVNPTPHFRLPLSSDEIFSLLATHSCAAYGYGPQSRDHQGILALRSTEVQIAVRGLHGFQVNLLDPSSTAADPSGGNLVLHTPNQVIDEDRGGPMVCRSAKNEAIVVATILGSTSTSVPSAGGPTTVTFSVFGLIGADLPWIKLKTSGLNHSMIGPESP